MAKYRSDVKLHDCNWKDLNEYMSLVKYKLFNYESSEIINFQKIESDFHFINSSFILDYGLYSTLFLVCIFLNMLYYILRVYSNRNSLLDTLQTMLQYECSKINILSSFKCTSSHTQSCELPVNMMRSANKKKTQLKLNSALNLMEPSGLLGTSNQPLAGSASDGAAYLPATLEPSKSSLDKTDGVKAKSKAVDTTTYSTDTLPGATGSHDQHYETDFGESVPISREETRKNVRAVFKEDDVDSILQSYQKPQITPTAIGNLLQPLVQDKTKPPAKTVPSSSVNKSHRSLPRRACLVHLNEQYQLDHDLLSQPRATKFLVKVRTEISPGRYMAKLELHCSR